MLARDNGVEDLCTIMGVSRSGYYKWLKRKPTKRDINREQMIELVAKVHEEHKTHGYRWVAAYICQNTPYTISPNYAYKCFKYLGIHSESRHQPKRYKRKEKDRYPNLIFSTWETVDRPRQVIVSDMTAFKYLYYYFEVTFYFDVFTKEMLTFQVAERRGCRDQYIDGLTDVISQISGQSDPTIIHTDQGSVYSSKAYNELIKDTNIIRSMSRAGKPTDNPVNEALNGWIKEELTIDFHVERCRTREEFRTLMRTYQTYYNKERPCYAIDYNTPEGYRQRYEQGLLPFLDTFEHREPSPEPKFVRERRQKADTQQDKECVYF